MALGCLSWSLYSCLYARSVPRLILGFMLITFRLGSRKILSEFARQQFAYAKMFDKKIENCIKMH